MRGFKCLYDYIIHSVWRNTSLERYTGRRITASLLKYELPRNVSVDEEVCEGGTFTVLMLIVRAKPV